ncbi:MAG: hypothetical protein OXK79_07605, partial [Chloroflexota bacterium]|nr:hypothetical protein [Chloroflexota bacterium]
SATAVIHAASNPRQLFQSSPGHEAECDVLMPVPPVLISVFQSSPGHEAECDGGKERHHIADGNVSILTRP